MEPGTATPSPPAAPPIDWARALRSNPALTRYEQARVMWWLAQHGWRRDPLDEWWGPLAGDENHGTFTLEWALRMQAGRSAQVLLEARGWEAYNTYGGNRRREPGPWMYWERLRRGRKRASIYEALQAEQIAEVVH